jgi:hypothetical protein
MKSTDCSFDNVFHANTIYGEWLTASSSEILVGLHQQLHHTRNATIFTDSSMVRRAQCQIPDQTYNGFDQWPT